VDGVATLLDKAAVAHLDKSLPPSNRSIG
jgi:hypothetical protein